MYLFKSAASLLLILSPLTTTSPSPNLSPRGNGGIDCKGSHFCTYGPLQDLIQLAEANQGGCTAGPGQNLYCTDNYDNDENSLNHICVFNQGTTKRLTPKDALDLLKKLKDHKCHGCGTVPYSYPDANDGRQGILKVDWVQVKEWDHSVQKCQGVCNPIC